MFATTQNLWDTVKAVLRGRFIAIQAYLKKQEKSQINNLTLHLSEVKWSCSVMSNSLRPHGSSLLHPWDFPGKSTGVGCHFLLQGIFPTQGLNPGLPHCSQMLLLSEPPGKPTLHLKRLVKEEMKNPRVSRRKEITKIRAEINAKETRDQSKNQQS